MHLLIGILFIILIVAGCDSHAESVIEYSELPAEGDIARGEELFNKQVSLAPTCESCHNSEATASPELEGYASVAGQRVEGQSAREYTFYAIAEPGQYLVEGYGNAMYNQYDEQLTPQQIADLVAYMLSLE